MYLPGAECKKQNNNVACENFSPEEEFKGTFAVANKLELGSNKVIEESKNVQLGEYSLPADMVKSLGDAKDITPSCEAPSSRRVAPEQVRRAGPDEPRGQAAVLWLPAVIARTDPLCRLMAGTEHQLDTRFLLLLLLPLQSRAGCGAAPMEEVGEDCVR